MCDHVVALPMRFDEPIPPDTYPRRPIYYGKSGRVERAIVTSRVLRSCMTHYAEGRTRPCYAPVTGCPGCERRLPRLWKGFLAALDWKTRREVVLMLTAAAARPYKERLALAGAGLRGFVLTLAHEHPGGEGRLTVLCSDVPFAGALPEPFDVQAHMQHVWAVEAAKYDPDNPNRYEKIPLPGH